MKKSVVIIGNGGHGRVIADIVRCSGDELIGFLDDGVAPDDKNQVLGRTSGYKLYKDAHFIVGIGNGSIRRKIVEGMPDVKWYTAIHPSAVISSNAVIGEGSAIMANSTINIDSIVGKHSIINTGAIVEHDNRIGDYVHVSVGAKLGGTVFVGNDTWLGIGAVISNNISICEECMIGAGTVVVHDINEKGTYVGVPARKIK